MPTVCRSGLLLVASARLAAGAFGGAGTVGPSYCQSLDGSPELRNDRRTLRLHVATTLSNDSSALQNIIRKEAGLLVFLLFIGMVFLPVAVFWVGQSIFGQYGGQGYGDFFGTLSSKIRAGDGVAWFLVLSPYLVCQCLRLMALGWRQSGKSR